MPARLQTDSRVITIGPAGKAASVYSRMQWGHCVKITDVKKNSFESVAENYESKTYKPLIENPCCYPSRRRFIYTQFTNWGLTEKLSHQDGLHKFLGYRSLIQSFFCRSVVNMIRLPRLWIKITTAGASVIFAEVVRPLMGFILYLCN